MSGVRPDAELAWLTPTPRTRRGRLRAAFVGRGRTLPRPSVLEVFSELLICAGVLLGLFLAWLLVWTDVTAGAAQREAVQELTWATEPEEGAPTQAADTVPEPTGAMFETGTTIAVIRIPRFGEDYVQPVSEGVDKRTVLDRLGIGHYPGTAMPGEVGNFAVAGHRTTYGKPLNRVAELQVGDEVLVDTPDARYTYKVTSSDIVLPSAIEVIAPEPGQPGVEPTGRWLTLTTCHPMFSRKERFIVHAALDSWTPKTTTTGAR